MEEGTIVKWRVSPGAAIQKGQVIFEVETDKAVVDVEAVDSGRLARIVVPQGGTTAVKQPVAYLAANDADVEAYLARRGGDVGAPTKAKARVAAATGDATPVPTISLPLDTDDGRVKASPPREEPRTNGELTWAPLAPAAARVGESSHRMCRRRRPRA